MATIEVKVPDIGDFKDVAVIELLVKPGDTVKAEQSLITVESDKASMEIPASQAGVVRELKVKLGDTVNEAKVNTEWGQITISGCILYSKGADSRDDGATDHSSEAKADDFILFPPPRAVARQEGKLK